MSWSCCCHEGDPARVETAMNFLSSLTGSFAFPASENPTVAMVEAAYRHHGLDWRYLNCEVPPELLGDAVRGARAMGWKGFNCSLPHKVAGVRHLDGGGGAGGGRGGGEAGGPPGGRALAGRPH